MFSFSKSRTHQSLFLELFLLANKAPSAHPTCDSHKLPCNLFFDCQPCMDDEVKYQSVSSQRMKISNRKLTNFLDHSFVVRISSIGEIAMSQRCVTWRIFGQVCSQNGRPNPTTMTLASSHCTLFSQLTSSKLLNQIS